MVKAYATTAEAFSTGCFAGASATCTTPTIAKHNHSREFSALTVALKYQIVPDVTSFGSYGTLLGTLRRERSRVQKLDEVVLP